jgi:hypothetical protein
MNPFVQEACIISLQSCAKRKGDIPQVVNIRALKHLNYARTLSGRAL